jgi:phospholipid/cholesterol/gamma-HCH transport system ATP-binding protein
MGLMQPVSGDIRVDGQNIVGLKERELARVRRCMGMLFQNGALFDSMSVGDNVAFPLRERGETDESLIAAKIDTALQMVNLHGQQEKMPVNLSGGMRKRVALARALINEPRCMLYDEPTAGLDPIVADSIDVLIRRLQRKLGVTSIVVTHDMKSAFAIADHVALLHEGRCYFYGTCDQLRASTDPVIRDFVEGRSHEEP